MPDPNSLWLRPIVLFDGFFDDEPTVPAFDAEDLVGLLTQHPDPACVLAGSPGEGADLPTCAGRDCPSKKAALSWSPASYREGGSRGNADVTGVNYAVFDLDHVPPGALAAFEADVAEYEHVVYSTHSHDSGDPTSDPPRSPDECYRVVFPLTRPVAPAEWEPFYDAVVLALGLPALDRRADLGRLYACPTARAGVEPFAAHRRGQPLDVDDALRAAGARPARPASPAPSASPAEPVSLRALRQRLSDARRSKAQGDERQRAQADVLGRVLDGRALASVGSRDDTILRACGLLAYWLPAGTPWPAVAQLLRPSIVAMLEAEPDDRGVDYMLSVAETKFERQAASRAATDAAVEVSRERTRAALAQVATRSLREVADELDARGADANDGGDWTDLLLEVGKNGPKVCEHNAQVLLACAPDLRGTVVWNALAKKIEFRGGPLSGTSPNDVDVVAAAHLQKTYSFYGNAALVGRALLQVARANPVEPVAEYLGELAWDGTPRLDTFFEDCLGAVVSETQPAEYVRAVSRKWLISLVARGLRPGCKVDTVLILEGAQGVGKSSALRALVGEAWFLDTALEVGSKDTLQAISGAWLVELGELASFSRAEQPRIRQFVTSQVDKFRPPYGRVTEEVARRCVLVGTTNPEGFGYLTDRTGNRRYLPVVVSGDLGAEEVVARVLAAREQIFAEAVAAFKAGERWWFPKEEADLAAAQAEARMVESSYEEAVERWWRGLAPAQRPTSFQLTDVADIALKMPIDRLDQRARTEIGTALRRLGFVRRGKRRYYEPTDELLAAPQETSLARQTQSALLKGLQGGKK